jgi:hypothetical protein
MKDEINLDNIIEKISSVNANDWKTKMDFERGSYSTNLGNEFDISLSVHYKDKFFNADDQDYNLSISPNLGSFKSVIFSGKRVKDLYILIEEKYIQRHKEVNNKETNTFLQKLRLFFQ